MIMAVRLTVSEIDRGQRSEGTGHSEIDCNSPKMQFMTVERNVH